MRRILIVLTRPPDGTVIELLAAERTLPDSHLESVELVTGVNYDLLLEKVFEADSIQVF